MLFERLLVLWMLVCFVKAIVVLLKVLACGFKQLLVGEVFAETFAEAGVVRAKRAGLLKDLWLRKALSSCIFIGMVVFSKGSSSSIWLTSISTMACSAFLGMVDLSVFGA